ncbi:hypothetical protein GQ55_1G093900 [Panicum hallii var. hallii]|uniref:DUF1677 domain-containing protein n=1 Tax=Panicum hallii var. hallii TaxID=1504633 RepID=A0A2T7F3Z0_9POAL|nr:hypothetical protein GQ55_1G093900 [Panicum hallii var. hallii]
MAPNGEAPAMAAAVVPLLATIIGSFGSGEHRRQQRIPSSHELRSCVADHDKEVEDGGHDGGGGGGSDPRDAARPAAEVEDAQCECCGMSEECTPAYIGAVRRRFSGRWVCGLCAEAVAEEAGKNGGDREAALAAHMAVCRRFNGFGRTHQALFQADAVIDIVRRLAGPRSPKFSAGTRAIGDGAKNGLAGSSGCMALVAGVRTDQAVTN